MFNNGDRVRVISTTEDPRGEFYNLGSIGTVKSANMHSCIEVLFDEDAEGNNESWYIHGDYLALLTEETSE